MHRSDRKFTWWSCIGNAEEDTDILWIERISRSDIISRSSDITVLRMSINLETIHHFISFRSTIFVQILPTGSASRTNLRIGDRILQVNHRDVSQATHNEAVQALLQATNEVILRVRHDPQPVGLKVRYSRLFSSDRTNERKNNSNSFRKSSSNGKQANH